MNKSEKMWTYYQTGRQNYTPKGYWRQRLVFKKIRKYLKKGKILEIGFGDGYLLNLLSAFYKTYGADISANNISISKKMLPKTKFKLMSVNGLLPYSDNSFDGFVAAEVLEHLSKKSLVKLIDEIYRILKKNGLAFLTFPAEENLEDSDCICPRCGKIFHRFGHRQIWTRNLVRERFHRYNVVLLQEFFSIYIGRTFIKKIFTICATTSMALINRIEKMPNRSYFVILKK